jgi:hypothetical protein
MVDRQSKRQHENPLALLRRFLVRFQQTQLQHHLATLFLFDWH